MPVASSLTVLKVIEVMIFVIKTWRFPNKLSIQNFKCLSHSLKVRMASEWQAEKERFLNLPLEEKRKLYQQSNYKTIAQIPTWKKYSTDKKLSAFKPSPQDVAKIEIKGNLNSKLSDKVSVWQGDITTLEIDAIANAANRGLGGGGGVDGAIHRAASMLLLDECLTLNGCETGEAKITGGYMLPAKYVIHTVGPVGEKPKPLHSCYTKSLQLAKDNGIKTIGFPSISTGVYGYPMEKATIVALGAVRTYLESNHDSFERVIFVVFSDEDLKVYENWMQIYFPTKQEEETA